MSLSLILLWLLRAADDQKINDERGNDMQEYRIELVDESGFVHEKANVP